MGWGADFRFVVTRAPVRWPWLEIPPTTQAITAVHAIQPTGVPPADPSDPDRRLQGHLGRCAGDRGGERSVPWLPGLVLHQQLVLLDLNAALQFVESTSTNALQLTVGGI